MLPIKHRPINGQSIRSGKINFDETQYVSKGNDEKLFSNCKQIDPVQGQGQRPAKPPVCGVCNFEIAQIARIHLDANSQNIYSGPTGFTWKVCCVGWNGNETRNERWADRVAVAREFCEMLLMRKADFTSCESIELPSVFSLDNGTKIKLSTDQCSLLNIHLGHAPFVGWLFLASFGISVSISPSLAGNPIDFVMRVIRNTHTHKNTRVAFRELTRISRARRVNKQWFGAALCASLIRCFIGFEPEFSHRRVGTHVSEYGSCLSNTLMLVFVSDYIGVG